MRYIGHFIIRMIAITFGILIAILAASIFISFGTFSGMFEQFFTDLYYVFEGELQGSGSLVNLAVIVVGIFSTFYVASLALLPAVLAIAIAELMRWQGLTINLVLGGLVGLFTGITSFASNNETSVPSEGTLIVLLAAGFIGGFFYWMIAGRTAGNWMGEPRQEIANS